MPEILFADFRSFITVFFLEGSGHLTTRGQMRRREGGRISG